MKKIIPEKRAIQFFEKKINKIIEEIKEASYRGEYLIYSTDIIDKLEVIDVKYAEKTDLFKISVNIYYTSIHSNEDFSDLYVELSWILQKQTDLRTYIVEFEQINSITNRQW